MLSYLLGLIQEFERRHGRVPVLVRLSTRHMNYLMQECPDLVRNDEPFPFGFRISVVSEDELVHPVLSVLPMVRSSGKRAAFPRDTRLARPFPEESTPSAAPRGLYHR